MKLLKKGAGNIRRIIIILMIYAAYTIQCTYLPRTGITVPVMLLIPVAFSAAMFEKEIAGMLMGLIAGALWDLASPLPDGLLAFVMTVLCCITGLMTRYLMRNTLLTALITNTAAALIITSISVISISADMEFSLLEGLILSKYLPGIIITVILTPVCYFTIRKLELHLRPEKTT